MLDKQNKIIAVDFDGTLCEDKYPNIGEPNFELISFLIDRRNSGDKLILWTCRVAAYKQDAVEWCAGYGLIFDAVNENLESVIKAQDGDSRKIYADVYIDDKAVTPFASVSLSRLFRDSGLNTTNKKRIKLSWINFLVGQHARVTNSTEIDIYMAARTKIVGLIHSNTKTDRYYIEQILTIADMFHRFDTENISKLFSLAGFEIIDDTYKGGIKNEWL